MLDFLEVWEKEIWKKRIAVGLAIFFFFASLGVIFSAFIFKGEEKTLEDYAYVYVVERLNYTPHTVRKAYFSRYQYKPLGYSIIVEDEIEEIVRLRLVSFFRPESIKVDEKERKVYVTGLRLTGKLRGNYIEDVSLKRVTVILSYTPQGFMLEEIR